MKFTDAKKLHDGDEIIVKDTGEHLCIVSAIVENGEVVVECEDGCYYTHDEISKID